jgi:hypothetical protein
MIGAMTAAVKARLDNGMVAASIHPGMRVPGVALPVVLYDITIRPTMRMPSTVGSRGHAEIVLTATVIDAMLVGALQVADDVRTVFDGGPFTDTTNGVKLVVTDMEYATGFEVPDDGNQDAERTISVTITLQGTEI